MQRRKLLKTIAVGGAVSFGMSSTGGAVQIDVEDLDGLQVVRNGDVIERVENPSDRDFRRLDAMAGDGGVLLNMEEDCSTYCRRDCDVICDGTCYYTHDCTDSKYCC